MNTVIIYLLDCSLTTGDSQTENVTEMSVSQFSGSVYFPERNVRNSIWLVDGRTRSHNWSIKIVKNSNPDIMEKNFLWTAETSHFTNYWNEGLFLRRVVNEDIHKHWNYISSISTNLIPLILGLKSFKMYKKYQFNHCIKSQIIV